MQVVGRYVIRMRIRLWSTLHIMQTIQIVLDEGLLKAADLEVKRLRTNRSRLFRAALREHLKRSRLKADEERERAAYLKIPEGDAMAAFEKVTAWPED